MFCYKCGEDNPDEAKFCRNCGAPLKEEEPAKKVEVIENPTNYQQNNYQSRQQTTTTTTSSKSDGNSWIICCCLGIIVIFIISALFSRF
jgi:uncharacterized membrane protein YvbJ